MTTEPRTTLDTIHVALERLGYVGAQFGGIRSPAMMFGVYRQGGETVVVSWFSGATVYEVSAATAAAADALRGELVRSGLECQPSATRIYVHGQEHIDAEVRKMLAPRPGY